ncbi:AlbA family DNA-binding domain-containing protein [Pyrococcus abyssi]|uniref:Bacterial regulatory protein, Fis family, putative n=1 Tax=Pyrococcus abyssi (strain GE5 / Orsay) TaxID=272844 RepID=Q9UYK0_PYRAB|nr:helix-turn-helix domain-containing protein [Pyrococcus abyssi]CAB50412.1 Bacterial regulatory protein, Fis family, putative [Pyrococcus abyssi GE5]CCE70961.1 TPA: putative transcriptional regulator [Pyrococcus abyssi GE5]
MNIEEFLKLIREGESERIEFKSRVTKDIHKEICALANAYGGYIIIGVGKDGKLIGCNAKEAREKISQSLLSIIPPVRIKTHVIKIDNKEFLVIEVPKSNTLCTVGGVAYIRVGNSIRPLSIHEIIMLSTELGALTWDEVPVEPFNNAKREYIEWFFDAMEKARGRKIPKEDWNRYLRSIKAVKGDKLTNAGVLFFTDVETMPHAGGRIIYMRGDEPIATKEFHGPIWKVIDEMFNELERNFKWLEVTVGAKRVRIPEYPPRAVREAIINAFAHRNYTISSDVRVFVYADRLIIKNPGGLMPGVDLDDPEHVPRNPVLSQLLYDSGYIEKYGYGIRMMRSECKKHGLVEIEFKAGANTFEVIFRKKTEELLDEEDKIILELLSEPKSSGEIERVLGLSKPTILKRLERLINLGLVKKLGSGRSTKYVRA